MVDIKFRNGLRSFQRSQSMVAVSAAPGLTRSRNLALEAIVARAGGTRHGRMGGYELIEISEDSDVFDRECLGLSRNRGVRAVMPVYHTSDDQLPFVPDGTVFVHAQPGTDEAAILNLARQHRLRLTARLRCGAFVFALEDAGLDPVEIAAHVQADERVEYAQPEFITDIEWLSLPLEEMLLRKQWHLENRGRVNGSSAGYVAGADARVAAAWRRLGDYGSSDVIIGIIDDGFDLHHPDLAGKSVLPWDFERESPDVSPRFNPTDPAAGNWHGTPCAGIAVARPRGGDAVGAAPNASLMPVRQSATLSARNLVRWFDYMTDNGAWIVSCSWKARARFYDLNECVYRAIERCATEGRDGKGCAIVFAAGNDGEGINEADRLNGFAVHPDVLAVSACTSTDERDPASSHGAEIAVCAPSSGFPGRPIATTDVTGTYTDAFGLVHERGVAMDCAQKFGGTSSASPLVSGVCALVLSANPELTANEVRAIIQETARPIGARDTYVDGHSRSFGFGCINADAAVERAIECRNLLMAQSREIAGLPLRG